MLEVVAEIPSTGGVGAIKWPVKLEGCIVPVCTLEKNGFEDQKQPLFSFIADYLSSIAV